MGELPTPVASAGPETTGVFFCVLPLPLLALALADPLPVPDERPLPFEQPELELLDGVALRDDRYTLGIGVSVSAGVFAFENGRKLGAASFAIDLHADLGRLVLLLSPHATVHVHSDIAALLGFEGQLMLVLTEHFAVALGTEQVVSVSRFQAGAVRVGPSVRPLVARFGRHRLSLQLVWLLAGFNERSWPGCNDCNARPAPYYTFGYGVLF